ncbi:MAG TPA: glycoside hydrolase family 3 C-terminal domain-containing protein [Terracidiphilus sp.]|nr:glycoside hydrolase family 3 C-terminal domain-containing protein [Terracidiphilus sp.]
MRTTSLSVLTVVLLAGLIPVAPAQMAAARPAAKASPEPSGQVWFDASQQLDKRVDALVSSMTLEEKAEQMNNHAPAIPRLGVPEYDYWSEGLHGIARSGYATLFPQAIGMAATWDTSLQHQIGTVVSVEARAKYNQAMRDNVHRIFFGLTIWSPNINIFRDPRWGRGQETYGEDPYLTSRMGVPFVTGLQGDDPKYFRTVATLKHFAVHSGPESSRHHFNVDVSPRDLEDTYLPAFRATVTEAHADSVMCAYNRIDGEPACGNKMLLQKYLRGYWHFDGFVTSDCGAITDFFSPRGHHFSPDVAHASAVAVKIGTDAACGRDYSGLVQAVHEGLISEAEVDTSLRRLFIARFRLGMFDPQSQVKYAQLPYSVVDSPEHRGLALKTAHESIVLLKNDGTLPLKSGIRRVAVIGPNAASLPGIEGNYFAIPSHPFLPVDGVEAALRGKATVIYQQGSSYVDGLPIVVPRTSFHPEKGSKAEGLQAEYFSSSAFAGTPVLRRIDKQIDFNWDSASPVPNVPFMDFGVRWTGAISVPAPGAYHFVTHLFRTSGCDEHEQFAVWIDSKLIGTNSAAVNGTTGSSCSSGFDYFFPDVAEHDIRVEYAHAKKFNAAGIIFQWNAPADVLRQQAVKAAQDSDLVLAFVGLSPDLEGEEMPVHVNGFEGGDRTSIELPKTQEQLLEALGATGKPIVVVLMSGSAVAMNWAKDHAAAFVEAWYPGEAGGEAIADILTGKTNPSGRLPVTFYTSDKQLPPFEDYRMQGRTYRYFQGEPLYPFGYGLSYTKFKYSGLMLSTTSLVAGKTLSADVTVTNTGNLGGGEVAELYLVPPQQGNNPLRSLEGFHRLQLEPHASTIVHFELSARDLSGVDDTGHRAVRAGAYQIYVGGAQPVGSAANGVTQGFTITGSEALPE